MASLVKELFHSGARNEAGAVIASGKVYFYVVGSTSEEVTIYADKDELTVLTQPVTLDAAGRAEVYLKEQAEVKILDADGVLKRLSLNATSVDAKQVDMSSITTWTGGDLAGMFGKITSSIGPDAQYKESSDSESIVPRNVHDVLHDKITPQDFGATGDGVADDTVHLQAAISRALATGLPLYLGPYSYKITAGLTASGPLRMYGDSAKESIILATSEAFDGLTIAVPGADDDVPFELRNFAIELENTSGLGNIAIKVTTGNFGLIEGVTATGGKGIVLAYSGLTRCEIRRCVVNVKGSAAVQGIGIVLGQFCTADECTVLATDTSTLYCRGFDLYDGAETRGCLATSCAHGFFFQSVTGKSVASECYAYSCGVGFRPYGDASVIMFSRCYGSVTADVDNYVSTPYINIRNSWSDVDARSQSFSSIATVSPIFTFDPGRELNVFKATYDGDALTVRVDLATPAPTLTPYTKYRMIVQMAVGTTASGGLTMDAGIASFTLPATLAGAAYYTAEFVVSTDGVLCQMGAWATNNWNTW